MSNFGAAVVVNKIDRQHECSCRSYRATSRRQVRGNIGVFRMGGRRSGNFLRYQTQQFTRVLVGEDVERPVRPLAYVPDAVSAVHK
jgi:hypothetical protein